MTVEELKQEAKKLGYKIVKIPEKIKKSNCICGANSRNVQLWYTFGGMYQYKCNKCGRIGQAGKSERMAKKFWNFAVERSFFVGEEYIFTTEAEAQAKLDEINSSVK